MIFFFFFNDTATTEIYTLSLHDALPISVKFEAAAGRRGKSGVGERAVELRAAAGRELDIAEVAGRVGAIDRKSTRLLCSDDHVSDAVVCVIDRGTGPRGGEWAGTQVMAV